MSGDRAFEAALLVATAGTVVYLIMDPWFPPRLRWTAVSMIAVLSVLLVLGLTGVTPQ